MSTNKVLALLAIALAAIVFAVPDDADAGRGSLKYGKKSRVKWDRNKWSGGGDTYAGESRKSSADRRKKKVEPNRTLSDRTVTASGVAVGTELSEPPAGAKTINAGGRRYSYAGGAFYQKVLASGEVSYRVVEPPYGAVVDAIPSDFQKVEEGSTTYYNVGGTHYRRIMRGGEVSYIVSKAP